MASLVNTIKEGFLKKGEDCQFPITSHLRMVDIHSSGGEKVPACVPCSSEVSAACGNAPL